MSDDLVKRLRAWIAPVEAAYADGGYAAGDGPEPPLDEMVEAADRIEHLELVVAGMDEQLEAVAADYLEAAQLSHQFRNERDAESALADQLAVSLLAVLQDEFSYIEGQDDDWLTYAAPLAAWRTARKDQP